MVLKIFLSLFILIPMAMADSSICASAFSNTSAFSNVKNLGTLRLSTSPRDQWSLLISPMTEATDSRLKNPFEVRRKSGGPKLPFLSSSYDQARFVEAQKPTQVREGEVVIYHADFGYSTNNEYRSIGPLNYIVMNKAGNVVEVGGGSKTLLEEFKNHLRGRKWTVKDDQTVHKINREIFKELRNHPEAQKQLQDFINKRGFPSGLAEQAQLVYFDKKILDLKAWATRNGYSYLQLRDAGWLSLSFDSNGRPYFRPTASNSIKIPFFKKGEITLWRTRNLKVVNNGPKYLSWPLNRSIERAWGVEETLFNGWKLNQAKGQVVVITEGEFKCLVAEKTTGILTVGIPGISQFYGPMVKALVESEAKEIIVVLDRDPKGKALMRVDGISDSERAAYEIARELERAGAKNVRVGRLPDVFNGGKVGIDDLILSKGVEPYLQTLESAVTPVKYAEQISLDTRFQEILSGRQKIASALKAYKNSVVRGGPRISILDEHKVQLAHEKAEESFREYLKKSFNNARRLDQPSSQKSSVLRTNFPERLESVLIETKDGQKIDPKNFAEDLLVYELVPSDFSSKCVLGCEKMDLTNQDIANKDPVEVVREQLIHDFPEDDFTMSFDVKIGPAQSWPRGPAVIFRKNSGKAVAIVNLYTEKDQSSVRALERILKLLRPELAP